MINNKLHEQRRRYLLDHTPTDRIIDEYLSYGAFHNGVYEGYSEFITSAGGDVTVYRVYGQNPDKFMCVIK